MGSVNIDYQVDGKLNINEIKAVFSTLHEGDVEENRACSGYGGNFATVDEVRFDVLDQGTGDYDKDYEKALDAAEKWCYVQAIYTKVNDKDVTLIVGWGAC